MDEDIIWLFFVLIAWLVVWFFVARKFDEIANQKGSSETYLWWVFFLGIFGCLMVIALPDRSNEYVKEYKQSDNSQTSVFENHEQSGYSLRELSNKRKITENHNSWKCSKCGSVNRFGNNFCKDCGEYK